MGNEQGVYVEMVNPEVQDAERSIHENFIAYHKSRKATIDISMQDLERKLKLVSMEFKVKILKYQNKITLLHKAARTCYYQFLKVVLENLEQEDRLTLLLKKKKLHYHNYLHANCKTVLHYAVEAGQGSSERTIDVIMATLTPSQRIVLIATEDSWGRTPLAFTEYLKKDRITRKLKKYLKAPEREIRGECYIANLAHHTVMSNMEPMYCNNWFLLLCIISLDVGCFG